MGVSCPYNDVENDLDSITVKSISFGDDESKTPVRSVNFKGLDSEPMILKSLGSGKMILEGSVSFKGRDFERMLSVKSPSSNKALDNQSPKPTTTPSPVSDPGNPQHEAATRLQKVYKSFRTRRKLADCAVLVEQSWWKALDFAELKRSSVSFFDIDKHETAISRWSRASSRAAKVGKGLSKNDQAQKLALQHWLEAIDPRHRYGHNLHFYYNQWLHSQSHEPFFYWLDIGEGKEVNLEKCPRSKLQQQCIKYLGPMERKPYEVTVVDGKFIHKQTGELVHTNDETGNAKWIFVLSTSKILYVGLKRKGTFQHSSFLAGGATTAAGRLVVDSGVLKAVWPHSGHYRPTKQNFNDFVSFLKENDVDLADVKMTPVDEEESLASKQSSNHLQCNSTEVISVKDLINEVDDSREQKTSLEIPKTTELFETEEEGTASEQVPKEKIDEDHADSMIEEIPEESILKRINSKKGMKSYQLGKQLSCKWTTGAGPRIGCVRDYPSELQFRALEQVNLSPRIASHSRLHFSPRFM